MRASILAVAATAVALVLPAAALAQTGASDSPSASNMKGLPNANGFGKDEGIDKSSPMAGTAGAERGTESAPSATGLKGPPNANGYQK